MRLSEANIARRRKTLGSHRTVFGHLRKSLKVLEATEGSLEVLKVEGINTKQNFESIAIIIVISVILSTFASVTFETLRSFPYTIRPLYRVVVLSTN